MKYLIVLLGTYFTVALIFSIIMAIVFKIKFDSKILKCMDLLIAFGILWFPLLLISIYHYIK